MVYNERTQVHFEWDPVRAEYKNLVLFMVYDQHTADLYPGVMGIPAKGAHADHIISGADFTQLAANIQQRLESLSEKLGGFSLDSSFSANLKATVGRFNDFAEAGKDGEFHRGETPIEATFHAYGHGKVENPFPNMTMHPIFGQGPYYALILGAGHATRINDKTQVMDPWDKPIPGLYVAGNCSAHPARNLILLLIGPVVPRLGRRSSLAGVG